MSTSTKTRLSPMTTMEEFLIKSPWNDTKRLNMNAFERKAKSEVEELKAQLASNSQDSSQNPSTPAPSFGSKSRQNSQESQAASTPDKKLTKSHEALIEECKKQLASTKQVRMSSLTLLLPTI